MINEPEIDVIRKFLWGYGWHTSEWRRVSSLDAPEHDLASDGVVLTLVHNKISPKIRYALYVIDGILIFRRQSIFEHKVYLADPECFNKLGAILDAIGGPSEL